MPRESPDPTRAQERLDDYTVDETITEAGLPPLTGSEAEITAAREIRRNLLMNADDEMSEIRATERLYELPSPAPPTGVARLEAALHRLRRQTDATWWIAHRNDSFRDLLLPFEAEILKEVEG